MKKDHQTGDATALARDILKKCPEAFFATCHQGQPHVRPVSIAQSDDQFYLRFASYSHWDKVEQIRANPKVDVALMDEKKRHLRIEGIARVVEEPAQKKQIFDAFPLIGRFVSDWNDPTLTYIEVKPNRIRVKDTWELEYRTVPISTST